MIYLIENKKERRNAFGWDDNRLSEFKDCIRVVENYNDLEQSLCDIFLENNVIVYHTSFRNSVDSYKYGIIEEFENKLRKNNGIYTVYFSGGYYQRKKYENECSLNPAILYKNLNLFISKYQKGNIELSSLLFGENSGIEENLLKEIKKINNKNTQWLDNNTKKKGNEKILFILTNNTSIQLDCPYEESVQCFPEGSALDDKTYCQLIDCNLTSKHYDAIYLPLCDGEVLSDYLGLRLAMLIRLSNTINRLTPIYIYGQADLDLKDLMNNECFDILKFKGVTLINSDYDSIYKTEDDNFSIVEGDYVAGLRSIYLNVPSNIGDNHSVSNKWGMYRWSYALDLRDIDIDKVRATVKDTLYFRYLSQYYSTQSIKRISDAKLKIEKQKNYPELNVLFVDDEADSGWDVLMCHLLFEKNKISYDCINGGFKGYSQDEIIQEVMLRIRENGVNLVILDLRLHPNDSSANINGITGFKLLKEVKNYNKGIQVIVFSATNKIWNLEALQKEHLDGFLLKESPENSKDAKFTENTIYSFIDIIKKCSKQTYKTDIYNRIEDIRKYLIKMKKEHSINKEFAGAADTLLTMSLDAMFSKDLKFPLATVYMNLFQLIELIFNEVTNEEKENQEDGKVIYVYKFKQELDSDYVYRFDDHGCKTDSYINIRNYDKICNLLYAIDPSLINADLVDDIVNKRNRFIHPDISYSGSELVKFDKQDVINIVDLVYTLIMKRSLI